MDHNARVAATKGSGEDGWPEVVVEFAEKGLHKLDWGHSTAEKVNDVVKMYNGRQAFRRYSWIRNRAVTNVAGNFRGMVINKQAKIAYDITVKNAKALERIGNALFLAAVGVELVKNASKMTLKPKSVGDVQMDLLVPSMAILKVFGGGIPLAAHWIAEGLENRCGFLGICQNVETIRSTDAIIQSSYETMMDPQEVRTYINTHLVF